MNIEKLKKVGIIKTVEKDMSLIRSLIRLSENDEKVTKKIKLTDLSARMIILNNYDILRMILEAISIDNGLKIYSHEGYAYFLKELNEGIVSGKFDRLRKLRNKLSYYGEDLSVNEVKMIIGDIIGMKNYLKEKYLKKFI